MEKGARELSHDLHGWLAEQLMQLMQEVVDEARSNVQNNQSIVSGDLHASIQILSFDAAKLEGEAGTELDYAIYVEMGRGPVQPVVAKMLHWIDPETGEDVFTKYAGPAEPQPFFWPVVMVKTEEFANDLAERLEEKMQEYGLGDLTL